MKQQVYAWQLQN